MIGSGPNTRWVRSESKHKIGKEYLRKTKMGHRNCEMMMFIKFGDENCIKVTKGKHLCHEMNKDPGIAAALHFSVGDDNNDKKEPKAAAGVSVPDTNYEM
uniref:FLYWCH-type domain-containing protein n=1 Tax=Meloidogyne hapla TaxID=6305 RepID=A0A1I8BC37_MELHA